MEFLTDNEGRLLTKQEIEELYKSEEGKALLKEYMLSAKIAFAANNAFAYLCELDIFKRDLSYDELQELCNVIYYCIKYSHWIDVEKFLMESTSSINRTDIPIC